MAEDVKSTDIKLPAGEMYAGYRANADTLSLNPNDLNKSIALNLAGNVNEASRPRSYTGTWVNTFSGENYNQYKNENDVYQYNHMFMTLAQSFDPFMQKCESEMPHWWLNRIPRGAYQLENGTVQETRIYRGGLSHYAGLQDWEELAPDPTSKDACAPLPFKTYSYAWETLAWSGKRTAWGSDPICIDVLRFVPKAAEQIGWILDTGVKFGTAIQNIWNRDKYIDTTVRAGRSFVMTSDYKASGNRRYFYNPFVKFSDSDNGDGPTATAVDKPFIVIDASGDIEPLNFDRLELERNQLKRRYPDAAVGRIGSELMFALCVSQEDVEKYIRGNEEERKYWIEANPQALIQHYGFAPTTFRRWVITDDQDQLRFKLTKYISSYTSAIAQTYGGVGATELANKPVYIAEYVPPEVAIRTGINGGSIPGPNPEYDTAELAIAVVFMNKVFTNLFVPDYKANIGRGTFFGPKTGLNGKWQWYNIQSPENPDQRVGNFKGTFEIVPKPDVHVYDSLSFLYRRCAQPLPSLCPAENENVNPTAKTTTTVVSSTTASKVGDVVTITLADTTTAAIGSSVTITSTDKVSKGIVLGVPAGSVLEVQVTTFVSGAIATGATVTID